MKISFAGLVVVLFSLAGAFAAAGADAKAFKNVGVEEFAKLRAEGKAVVLDVRTKTEFEKGHIPGAINIDWTGANFEKQAAKLDKGKMYLVHCASGRRSVSACEMMAGKLQLTNCVNLERGFSAWEKAGRPVEK